MKTAAAAAAATMAVGSVEAGANVEVKTKDEAREVGRLDREIGERSWKGSQEIYWW